MASFTPVIPEVKITGTGEWPTRWPCLQYHDQVIEDGQGEYIDLNDVDIDDYVTCKELGHARVPVTSVSFKKTQIVDQSTGEHPGLVDGDYITCELKSEGDDHKRVYTQVCLRGTKGMHLIELTRVRTKTWKFCFYQALVALLVKTQLRLFSFLYFILFSSALFILISCSNHCLDISLLPAVTLIIFMIMHGCYLFM